MIPIRNVYYMLAYAFSVLNEQGYRNIAVEEFDNAAELCAAILDRGITNQVKCGLWREYVGRKEPLSSLRGKVEVTESVKSQALLRRQIVCSYHEFSVDTQMNRIVKSTVLLLLRLDISKMWKKRLKRLMAYFTDVEPLDLRFVDWNMRFDRNNQTYRMLMGVCWLVVKGLIHTQSDGTSRMMDFFDGRCMSRLYEKFILEYYRKEHPELSANASYIGWVLDDGFSDMLPIMKSDISLVQDNKVLIIDAKYYSSTMQQRFDTPKVHSANLYQIFTYVKNKEAELAGSVASHEVSGMLLYARTDEDLQPDRTYQMSGNRISVKTLDLNQPFYSIREQLDAVAEAHFASNFNHPMEISLTGDSFGQGRNLQG